MNDPASHIFEPGADSRQGRAPTEFAGTIDEMVMSDVQRLVPRGEKTLLSLMRFVGIGLAVLGIPMALLARGYPELLYVAIMFFAMGANFLLGWWMYRRGRSRFARDRAITGRIYGAGIEIDQLGGRTDWAVFGKASLNSSAALLYVHYKHLFGIPLHRSFFESEQAWQDVSQLIRERVRNVTLVADE